MLIVKARDLRNVLSSPDTCDRWCSNWIAEEVETYLESAIFRPINFTEFIWKRSE